MLSSVRGSLNSWAVRLLFLVLLAAFVAWGVGDFVRNLGRGGGRGDYVVRVGDRTVDPREFDTMFRRALAEAQRRTETTPAVKRAVAGQVLQTVVGEASLDDEARRLRLAVPEAALRDAIHDLPQFKGEDGKYDPARARELLRQNGMTEARLQDLMRRQVMANQLLGAVQAGVAAPPGMAAAVFRFEGEKRSADLVSFPFAAITPPAPTDAQVRRWYDNHPDQYSSPEYRRIRLAVLLPDAVSKDIAVSDDELRAAYDARASVYSRPDQRSAQVILVKDPDQAKALAAAWRAGAGWDAMQKQATADGGSAVEIADAPRAEFPAAELAEAVFATRQDAVPDPVHDALGWHVVKVTGVNPGVSRSFDSVKDELRQEIVAEKSGNALFDRANQIDNILGTGESLDQLPGDLGLKAATGTLDAQGKAQDGGDAPIPGPAAVRQAVTQAAFAAAPNEPPHLKEVRGPQGVAGYYALVVESVTQPAVRPFDDVAAQARADWTADARRHTQDAAAAALLGAIRDGTKIGDAAKTRKLTVTQTKPVSPNAPGDVPREVVQPLFVSPVGTPFQAETASGFVVGVTTGIEQPDPAADAAGFDVLRTQLRAAVAADTRDATVAALRDRLKPQVNAGLLERTIE